MPTDGGRRALRLTLGVTIAFVVTQAAGWPLSFVLPIFAALLLQAPAPMPFGAAFACLAVSGGCMIGGLGLAGITVHYPTAALGLIAVLLPWIFIYAARGGAMIIMMVMLLSVMVLPIVGEVSLTAAGIAAWYLWIDLASAIALSAVAFAILPPTATPAAVPAKPKPPVGAVLGPALRMTIIIYPLTAAYLVFGWASILTLVFSALLALQLNSAAGLKTGQYLLLANFVGGILAVIAYSMLVMAPSFALMAAVVCLLVAVAAQSLFSGRPTARLWGSALNAILAILGGCLTVFGGDADAKLSTRLIQIAAAVLYVAAAYAVLDALRKPRAAAAAA